MTLRRAAVAALCAAVLVSVGPAAAAVALDGAYRTTVGGSGLLSGTWTRRPFCECSTACTTSRRVPRCAVM